MRRHAFTVVEMLLVVLIVGITIGVMIPTVVRARDVSRGKSCVENLRLLEKARNQAYRQGHTGPTIAWLVTKHYLPQELRCPAGGHYRLGKANEAPTCSVGARAVKPHVLR